MGLKVGAVPLFKGELGPHLTQCRLGRAYVRTKRHLDSSSRLVTIDMSLKVGDVPLLKGSWVPI